MSLETDMSSLPRVKAVSAAKAPLTLKVEWADGRRSTVDLTGLVYSSKHFRIFADHPDKFRQVKPVNWGDGIGWENGLDYSANTLRTLADEQLPMPGKYLLLFEKQRSLHIEETAHLFSVTARTIKNWRNQPELPLTVCIALRQFEHDPTLFAAHYRPIEVKPRGRPKEKRSA